MTTCALGSSFNSMVFKVHVPLNPKTNAANDAGFTPSPPGNRGHGAYSPPRRTIQGNTQIPQGGAISRLGSHNVASKPIVYLDHGPHPKKFPFLSFCMRRIQFWAGFVRLYLEDSSDLNLRALEVELTPL